MKKHTFEEHLSDTCWVMFKEPYERIQFNPGGETRYQTALMVTYERWLNNRPLMSEEDAHNARK